MGPCFTSAWRVAFVIPNPVMFAILKNVLARQTLRGELVWNVQWEYAINKRDRWIMYWSITPTGSAHWSNRLTRMLLVANLANTKWYKKMKNAWDPGPGIWGLIWEDSVRAIQWIPIWQGLDGFQKCCVIVLWTKVASALEGLTWRQREGEIKNERRHDL